ncbi:DNA cytosine methyltransferase [Vallicoccus soli]|uniref:DNA cytosine methyltransferase n=1 Tax=Vallicoccus soli TaxID=2339232 RepID=UPI001402CA90|nr:DNA cytosine methyltransferase [Vallicoccus soli]
MSATLDPATSARRTPRRAAPGAGARGEAQLVSLFSGAGGLDVGLERAGWSTTVATDVDADCVRTLCAAQRAALPVRGRTSHRHLQGARLLLQDVRTLSAADLRPERARADWRPDLLAGGPPCQPWSSAGHQRGLEDPRGQLLAHMLRLVGELRPRFVLFENVRGLVTALGPTGRPGEVLESIQADLAALGYASRVATLNAADYGAAQRRVRLLLLASAEYELPEFPAPTHARLPSGPQGLPFGPEVKPWVTLGETLDALPAPEEAEVVRPAGPRAAALEALEPGQGLRTGGRVEANRPGGHWGYRQDSFLADPSLPSRTIRAASTPDWVRESDGRLRRLTVRECAVLQGFPADWPLQGGAASRFRQVGNAVQVDVAQALGEVLLQSLRRGPAAVPPVSPPWPAQLLRRTRYTAMEHRVNGAHRVRVRAAGQAGASGATSPAVEA